MNSDCQLRLECQLYFKPVRVQKSVAEGDRDVARRLDTSKMRQCS